MSGSHASSNDFFFFICSLDARLSITGIDIVLVEINVMMIVMRIVMRIDIDIVLVEIIMIIWRKILNHGH